MKKYALPVDYRKLSPIERKEVRLQYIEEQNGLCFYCENPLNRKPQKSITRKQID